MTKVFCGDETIPDFAPVTYHLLVDQWSGSPDTRECYGVEIDMEGRSEQMRFLTTDYAAAAKLLSQLRRCQVTPASLRDIVEDWMQTREMR